MITELTITEITYNPYWCSAVFAMEKSSFDCFSISFNNESKLRVVTCKFFKFGVLSFENIGE
jgi:hypothetical protein